MTHSSSSTRTARLTAQAIFTAVIVLFAFYGAYWVRFLVPLPTEMSALALSGRDWTETGSAYGLVLKAWGVLFGPDLIAARILSLLAAVSSLVLVFHIGRRLSHDPLVAACLTLTFVLYPQWVATLVCATPHALVLLLSLVMMELMLRSPERSADESATFFGNVAGGFAACAMLLIPLAFIIYPPHFDADLSASGHNTIFTALILPYAMVPAFAVLSALAACSKAVRVKIDTRWLVVVLPAPLVVGGILWLAVVCGLLTVGQLVTAMGYGMVFTILTPWPLIVWVLNVMPRVKSLLAWIVFPVVMYSCFG